MANRSAVQLKHAPSVNFPFLNSFFNDLDVVNSEVRDLMRNIDAILVPSVWLKAFNVNV